VQHSTVINCSIFQVITTVWPTTLVMGKILYKDKARIETLRELVFGYRTTAVKFLAKGWKLCSVKAICKRVDKHGSATEHKPGSSQPIFYFILFESPSSVSVLRCLDAVVIKNNIRTITYKTIQNRIHLLKTLMKVFSECSTVLAVSVIMYQSQY